MKHFIFAIATLLPTAALADGIEVQNPIVPLAPPGAMAHAGFMTLLNTGDETRSLIGVSAQGYGMAHLHLSVEKDGIATMSALHQLDIEPGQSVTLENGSFHIMLMHPKAPVKAGDAVLIDLTFANGEVIPVTAEVMKLKPRAYGS